MKSTILLLLTVVSCCYSKIYSPQEFTQRLRANNVPEWMFNTWNCIVRHESHYDTRAVNTNTWDHGIFQISQIYWCSADASKGCHVTCDSLNDDNIDNDIRCAMQIFEETQRLKGNGFMAWTVYPSYCA